MQIISIPSHYQLVYINLDISSSSLISYRAKQPLLQCQSAVIIF